MSLPKWVQILDDISLHCGYIVEDTIHISYEELAQNRVVRQAIERNLIIIGIAATRLRDEDDRLYEEMESLRYAIGLRNRLAHGYGEDISERMLWEIIASSIPALLADVNLRLESYDGDTENTI